LVVNSLQKTDIWVNIDDETLKRKKQDFLYAQALIKLKDQKKCNNSLLEVQKKYTIIDSYPKNKEKSKSWFWWVMLEDKITKEKIIAIRWTEIKDWWDLKADKQLVFNKVPIEQTKEMINFINKNLWVNEKFKIVWHSLWWALSQIATAIFSDRIIETYTFNSPWAKKLEVNIKQVPEKVRQYFERFDKNKAKEETWDLVTNVKWNKWLKLIADLWEDIWNKEIILKNLTKHWIIDMANYIDKLPENSSEFDIIYRNKNKKLKEN